MASTNSEFLAERWAIGLTRAGRYLKVIFSPDDLGDDIFVITAYTVPPKQVRALKQRLKRRRS
jgi:hypothetical protein